ncbi:MAG: hypothetical protein K9J37_05665 [Saprospiraceae bacterium]|nr:hypothetical protein [Saprospiraceae bacterium]MCF8249377.1 hypothetical protein [Saprospiraceae bacterium]MCF8279031.1 hypothetical protein [Bacteroidales bacterium]MCF8311506.1 hypothetical protein [Saprospiraceae bacterium]MCF8439996.1 hypothetical protein [Saprospiraceae bacterium]
MKTKFLLIFLTLATWAQAQHSYLNDRRFFTPDELIGYDFKPSMKEVPNERQEELTPGQYSFGITHTNLYVKGEGLEGVYNINNMQPEDFGFKLTLMNARDARLQGHLKVILNKYNMVEALIFKRSPTDKETIFYLPAIPGKVKDEEKSYFTDRGELVIEAADSIWGKKFYPFFRIHTQDKVQERLRMKDSTSIAFVEEITIEEKEIKRRKKDKNEDVPTVDSVSVEVAEMPADSSATQPNPDVKVKITKEYFVVVRSIVQFEGGMREDKTWKYPVKRISEKEDKQAGVQEERYQWEFVNDKKENIILYLNGDHTVSTMIINDKTYKMRGI